MDDSTVLVVGNRDYKASIAKVLRNCGYKIRETTDFERFDEPLRTVWGMLGSKFSDKRFLTARAWISANSLRRLEESEMKVVCCATTVSENRKWMHVIDVVFAKNHDSIAVVTRDKTQDLTVYLQEVFAGGVPCVVDTRDKEFESSIRNTIDNIRSFKVTIPVGGRYIKPWSSERVILFGRTGSGKSTIAHMLTVGNLRSPSAFDVSSSARGVTKEIVRAEGRGWCVTDTPGFGESREGTVDTNTAVGMIKRWVINACGIYSHFIYVMRKDRFSLADERLWQFFTNVFKGAERNFTVVVTNCENEFSERDEIYIRKKFEGCNNFVYLDFPPVDSEDKELEEDNKAVRADSLTKLEEALANLCLADMECKEGACSYEALRTMISEFDQATVMTRVKGTLGVCHRIVRDNEGIGDVYHRLLRDTGIADSYHKLFKLLSFTVLRTFHHSNIDENIMLLP